MLTVISRYAAQLFFEERGFPTLDQRPDPRGEEIRAREDEVARMCRFCGQGRSTLIACGSTARDEGPRRDRFELIELD